MFIDSTFDSYREKATQVDDVWNFQTFLNHDSYHEFIEKFYFTKKQKNKKNKRKSRKIIVYKKFDKNTKIDTYIYISVYYIYFR